MSKIRFSLSKQLVIITLSSLLLMIALISLVLPKSLEPFFERTVYSYLDKPLEGFGKDRDFMIENENIIYIQNVNGEFVSNDNYREFLNIDSLDEIAQYLVKENGKFAIKGSTYYYSVKKTREFRMIAITNDSYIKELRNNMLYITIPVVTLIFLIILVILLLWSNYLVKRIGRIKNKIDNFNNPDYKVINKDLNYKFECDKNSKVKGTEEVWESVIDNILSNAVRYANKEIKITINKNRIVFYNDGENIDEKIINKIFDSYVKGKKGEHGLGLSIVKKNLESLNYKVYAKNLKKGVEFIIERK